MLDKIKCFVGGMSKECVDSLILYHEKYKNIGIISSRRQLDLNSGYVNNWNSCSFNKYVKSKSDILLGRDHAGPEQGDVSDDGVESILNDTKFFDIIHIDPWKKAKSLSEGIHLTVEMLKTAYSQNNKLLFEVGTEENIKSLSHKDLDLLLFEIKKNTSQDLFNNVKYAVIQSGMQILGDRNVGKFNPIKTKCYINVCKKHKILSKEHNTDYSSKDIILELFDLGVDCINIAPEIASIHTKTLMQEIDSDQKELLFKQCLNTNRWQKWFQKDFDYNKHKQRLVETCGHYAITDVNFDLKNTDLLDNKIEAFLNQILS